MYSGSLNRVSNREHWIGRFRFRDRATKAAIDLTEDGIEVTFAVRAEKCCSPLLVATFANGKMALPAGTEGIAEWTFTADEMRTLCPGTYRAGVVMRRGGIDTQIFEGSAPVVDGVVP